MHRDAVINAGEDSKWPAMMCAAGASADLDREEGQTVVDLILLAWTGDNRQLNAAQVILGCDPDGSEVLVS